MAKCFGLTNIGDVSSRSFFFDANVLIYIFGNSTSRKWETQYSKIFSRLMTNTNLFVDFTVISEFINREAKLSYHSYLIFYNKTTIDLPYKAYRNSPDGITVMNGIYMCVKDDILSKFKITEESYSKRDILEFLTNDSLDFNDKAIKQICINNDYILVTNDSDFKITDIDILTANNKLLSNT